MPLSSYLRQQWMVRLEEERWKPEEPRGTWASNIGHPCLFYLWAQRARWEDATTPEPTLLCIYDLGNHYEAYAKARLRAAGFEVLEEQRLFVNEEFNIRGRCDGRIRTDDPEAPEILKTRGGVLCEIKGINDSDWGKFQTIEDMLSSNKPWARKWPHQLAFYVEEADDEIGVFAFINKMTGEPNFVVLEREKWVALPGAAYHRVGRVNGYLELGRQAPAMAYDPLYCARCDWAHICPTAAAITGSGEAVQMKSDHMDGLLANVNSFKEEGSLYHNSRDAVKEMLNGADVWPENGCTKTLITDGFTLLLEVKGGRKYWSIQTERGE